MRNAILILIALGLVVITAVGTLGRHPTEPTPLQLLKERYAARRVSSADHTKLAALQRDFTSPQQVTEACLSCHTKRGEEVMASSHWNWSRREYVPGRGIRTIGKKNVLNNFCVGVSSNLKECDSCHAGYGYVDGSYDFSNPSNIDCLACHDNSQTYNKTLGGLPDASVDLRQVAQHVGRPARTNCGTCHFFGGGGNNVKHGDLEQALFDPPRGLDVHMASTGGNMDCVDCHAATRHQMLGKSYALSSMNRDRVACETCHTGEPHADDVLNEHTVKVSCQTCHIPEYARANATKMTWDWSTAGRLRDGQPYVEKDAKGNPTYMSIKGTFTWATDVRPEYAWFNGTASHYLLGDRTEAGRTVQINTLFGSYGDPTAKIVPVKVHRARQIHDPRTGLLIQPKLYAERQGEGAFWRDFDWNKAAEAGMAAVGLPYSGTYDFVNTAITLPVNHMVAPKERAVACSQCHTRDGSRLAGLDDFYLPGRDRSRVVDTAGRGLLLLTLVGIMVHGGARIVSGRKRGRR